MIRLGIQDIGAPPLSGTGNTDEPLQSRSPEALGNLKGRLQVVMGPRFEVLAPVALGGMATLFQLKHTHNGSLFAAKDGPA